MLTENDLKKLIPVIKTYCSDVYLSRSKAKKVLITIMIFIGILIGIAFYQSMVIHSLSERLLIAEEEIAQMKKEVGGSDVDAIQESINTMNDELDDMDRWFYDELCKLDERVLETEIELGFEDESARIPIGAWYKPAEGSFSIDP